MTNRIQRHAIARLDFSPKAAPSRRLAACKRYLALEEKMSRMRHRNGEAGLALAQQHANVLDCLLSTLFADALARWEAKHGVPPSVPISMVALGGYGRSEMSPASDIDIMFLFPSKAPDKILKPLQEHLTAELLYTLWDCGLKVGHSTRTVDEVFAEAKAEIQSKTALLEARLIAGSTILFETFEKAYRQFYRTDNPRGYIQARLLDQKQRRNKHGDSIFLQEPDIKTGVGGMRDYQNLIWMLRVKLGIMDLEELVPLQYMQPAELKAIKRAYNFLHRVRNELHFRSKRPNDLLNLALQPKIALGLGYKETNILQRVERFMRDYYRAAQCIFRSANLIETRLALTADLEKPQRISFREAIRARRYERSRLIDGFVLRGQELGPGETQVFKNDPVRLIRVFRLAQRLGATISFELQGQIRESLPLMTRKVLKSPDTNTAFRSILWEAGNVYPTLSLMHDLGVLGRFIPEFDALTCLVQHEFYHRYTADIHTLNTIKALDQVFTAVDGQTRKYRTTLHQTSEPVLLYLILLLHDIGKARGIKGHAESGVAIAEPLLKRLHITGPKAEVVTFIIKNHLAMARFWQKRDIDDPNTSAAFADVVGDAEKLRYLYVHTFCDAQGTAQGLWNGYKDSLHSGLYRNTLDYIIHGENLASHHSDRLTMIFKELVTKKIPGIGKDEITAHFNLLPERYFIHTDPAEIALHIQMVNRLLKSISTSESVGSLRPVIDWQNDVNRSLTVVNVITWDRGGLFYKLAGALSVAGLSILGAKVISRSDHIAIDTFYVVEPGQGAVQGKRAQEVFAQAVEASLVANQDLLPKIIEQANKTASHFTPSSEEGMPAAFPPSVDVYHELSMQRTIVEIQARDEIGLLFRMAKTISDMGFDITFARINTERDVAIDTFYIEDASGGQVRSTKRLEALKAKLELIVNEPHPVAI